MKKGVLKRCAEVITIMKPSPSKQQYWRPD
jgi:hypothetical protein